MTTRRERLRQENREGILNAALAIAQREEWPAVTIRRIADEIGYSSPIIYQHFDNKDAALQVLMEQGYENLEKAMRMALGTEDVEQRLLGIGLAYLHFARNNGHIYELMHGLGGVTIDAAARVAAAAPIVELTLEVINEWAASKHLELSDPLGVSETCWGILHGMSSLGRIPDIGYERAEQLTLNALKAVLFSLESGA